MSNLAISVIVACIVSMSICGQVNKAKVAPEISEWGRKSIWEMRRINRMHRQLFPTSQLRKINVALMCLGFAALLVLVSLAITHPGPPSRTSDSQMIKSSR
jgi:hypothetical protein